MGRRVYSILYDRKRNKYIIISRKHKNSKKYKIIGFYKPKYY